MTFKYQLNGAMTRWLSHPDLNVFCTVTLKKSLPCNANTWRHMDVYEAEKTGIVLKDRVLRALYKTKHTAGASVPFLTFYELSPGEARPHFHIATAIPDQMPFDEFEHLFRATVARLEWVHQQIDVQPITYNNGDRWQQVCSYGLKRGPDAFLPAASQVPMIG